MRGCGDDGADVEVVAHVLGPAPPVWQGWAVSQALSACSASEAEKESMQRWQRTRRCPTALRLPAARLLHICLPCPAHPLTLPVGPLLVDIGRQYFVVLQMVVVAALLCRKRGLK